MLALSNWRVRTRAVALVVIPTVTAMVFGGLRIESAAQSAGGFHQVEQLAVLGGDVTALAQALEQERDVTVGYVAAGRPASGVGAVRQQQAATDQSAVPVNSLASRIGKAYPVATQVDAASVRTRIADLPALRSLALQGSTESMTLVTSYSEVIADLLAVDDQIAQGSGNSTLVQEARTLGALSRMKDQVSQQRAILQAALTEGQFEPGAFNALTVSAADQAGDLDAFQTSATLNENQFYIDTVSGSQIDQAQAIEQRAMVLGSASGSLHLDAGARQQWYPAASVMISRMRAVEQQLVTSIITQSAAQQRAAVQTAVIIGGVVLVVLLLVLIFTIAVARSLVRPLRRLREGALDVAGKRLPEAVRRLDETDGASGAREVDPIDVDLIDEIGEVARAFDQVHREALRLAAGEAMLRGSVNSMFVNLSRRSQTLVERQLRLIDRLEQAEQDPARLGHLFEMDHLATRMRRNSENLLVLAGHEETSRRWNEPAALVDVLRAAVSEIDQYERVAVDVQPGLSLRGQAVSDSVHLLAEILENATSFSAADTRVNVLGRSLSSGGFLMEITDSGVGMTTDELARENWRLDNPPTVDVSVSRRMGLFVVGRLAARHNIRVRLRPSESGGVTALVWIPDSLIVRGGDEPGGWQRRIEVTKAAMPRMSTQIQALTRWPGSGAQPQPGQSGAELARQSPARPALRAGDAALEPPKPVGELTRDTGSPAGQPAAAAQPGQPPARFQRQPGTPGQQEEAPGAGMPPPWTPPRGLPSAGAPAGGVPPRGIPSAATPAGGIPGDPTPAGLPRRRIPGAGPSPHNFRGEYELPQPDQQAAAFAADPYSAPVVVPPPPTLGPGHRLPIFDSVESEWFHSRAQGVPEPGQQYAGGGAAGGGPSPAGKPASGGADTWTSPADEGFSAAQAAAEPAVGDVTAAGLPRRVPQANAIPGSVAAQPAAPALIRSPEAARSRLESFQDGVRQARAAIATEEPPDDE